MVSGLLAVVSRITQNSFEQKWVKRLPLARHE